MRDSLMLVGVWIAGIAGAVALGLTIEYTRQFVSVGTLPSVPGPTVFREARSDSLGEWSGGRI